jgi:hypothetical protein
MMRLRRLSDYKDRAELGQCLESINTIRSNCPWTQKTYDDLNSKDVWIIRSVNMNVGFAEIELREADFSPDNRMFTYVHELHIAPSRQRTGAGGAVLRHLLKKGLDIEFVIAKCNEKAYGLVRKFIHTEKYVNKDTVTVHIACADNPEA